MARTTTPAANVTAVLRDWTTTSGRGWRLRPSVWRAAWWALLSVRQARRQLRDGVARPVLRPPPALPDRAGLGVDAVIGRLGASCLEGALVRQRWLAAHGIDRDVVIGLPSGNFGATPAHAPAHAWVDGFEAVASAEHLELHRIPSPPGSSPAS